MANKNEAKIKFTAETGDFNDSIKKSNEELAELRSEMKLNETQMKNTGESVEGLQKKQKNLEKQLQASSEKTEALRGKLDKAVEVFGENSTEANKLRIQLTNAETAEEKLKSQISAVNSQIEKQAAEQKEASSATKQLTDSISKQETELSQLKQEYTEAVLKYGSASKEAKELGTQIKTLSSNLNDNKEKLEDAEKAADEYDKSIDKAGDTSIDVNGKMDKLAAGAAALGAAFVAAGKAAIDAFNDVDAGADNVIKATGIVGEEGKKLEESYMNVATSIVGDFETIGSTLGEVNTRFGYTGEEAEAATEKFIKFSDVTGMDAVSAVQAVSRAIESSGLETSEYKNILDSLTTAGQYTGVSVDTLANALTDNGAVMREMGYDTNTTIAMLAQFEKAGVDSNAVVRGMRTAIAKWSKDGKDAKTEFAKLVKGIKNGSADAGEAYEVFGSKAGGELVDAIKSGRFEYEDMVEVIEKSKGSLDTTFDATVDGGYELELAAQKAKVKMAELGDTVLGKVVPVVNNQLLPAAEDFIEYVDENFDDIIDLAKTLGVTFGTVFAINKISNFISSLSTLKTTFTALGGVIAAHPIAAIATGITLATGAAIALNDAMDREIEKTWGLSDAEKDLNEAIKNRTNSVNELSEATAKANDKIDDEAARNQNLWKELQNIVDANGKIKKGYEDRAAVITGLLADSLGIEIQIVDGQIQKYDELKKSIEEVIRTKRAEALLTANEAAYTEAWQGQAEALQEYTDKLAQCEESGKDLAKAQSNLDYLLEQSKYATSEEAALSYAWSITQAKKEVEVATEAHKENTDALADAESNYFNYCNTIENYEGLMAAVASGDVKQLDDAMSRLSNSFLTAENATKEMLEKQLSDFKTQYANMKLAVEQGMPGVSQEQVEQMGLLVQGAETELNKLTPKASESGKKAGESFKSGLSSKSVLVRESTAELALQADNGLNTSKSGQIGNTKGLLFSNNLLGQKGNAFSAGSILAQNLDSGVNTSKSGSVGNTKGSQFAAGVKGTQGQAKTAGKAVATNADGGMASVNPTSTGASFGTKFGSGITGKKASIYGAGGGLAESGKKGLKSVSTKGAGEDFADGFGNGIESKNSSIWNKAWNLAKSAWNAVCEALDSHSPSRLTFSGGENFDDGFILGIDSKREEAVKSAERLATDTANALHGGVISSGFSFSFPEAKLPTFETTGKINFAATGGSRQYGYMTAAIQNASDMQDLTAAVAKLADRPVVLSVNGRQFALATASDTDSVNGLRSTFKSRGLILD